MLSYLHGQIGKQMKRDSSQQKVRGNTDQDKDGKRLVIYYIHFEFSKIYVMLWLEAAKSVSMNDRHMKSIGLVCKVLQRKEEYIFDA